MALCREKDLKIKDELKHLLRRLEQISNDYREKVCSKMQYTVQLQGYFGKFAAALIYQQHAAV